TSTTTTANLLSCSGIYAAIRVRVSVMTVFTSVKLFYVGTSTVGKSGPSGGAVASVTGAGTVSCSPTTGAVVCTGSGSGGSPGGSSGDVQINNGSSGFAAGALNDNGTTITATETITPAVSAAVALGSSSLPWGTMYSTGKVNYGNAFDHVTTTNTSANVATNDLYYYCDATGAPVIMTLPAAMGSGRHIGVMKLDSTTNACSLARSGSDDIDGATAAQASVQYASFSVLDAASTHWIRDHANQGTGDWTGTNFANQVKATHLTSALPVLQGGTGLTAGSAGNVLGGATPSYVKVTSSYVDSSVCATGACSQTAAAATASAASVTSGHLVSAGAANAFADSNVVAADAITYHTPATGLARTTASSQAIAGSELSGDVTTSGSNSVTLKAQYKTGSCQTGLGDGYNLIPAQTYLQSFCKNDSGVTRTITAVACYTDAGTSTLASAGNTLGSITAATNCSSSFATGSLVGTALTNGDYIKFSFVADGSSHQTTWVVSYTQ
ncbi:MAG: hypothetical protein ABSH01_25165, partial [Terriglobia bacterium]